MSRDDVLNLIFLPGFSTTRARHRPVRPRRGHGRRQDQHQQARRRRSTSHSEVGIGTSVTITLPITLAIISALVVRVGGQTFAIPLANVQEALLLDPRSMRTVEGREVMTLRGGTLPLCRLRELFRLGEQPRGGPRQSPVRGGQSARQRGASGSSSTSCSASRTS